MLAAVANGGDFQTTANLARDQIVAAAVPQSVKDAAIAAAANGGATHASHNAARGRGVQRCT